MALKERISRLFLLMCSIQQSYCGKIRVFRLWEAFRVPDSSWIECPSLQLPLIGITHVKGRVPWLAQNCWFSGSVKLGYRIFFSTFSALGWIIPSFLGSQWVRFPDTYHFFFLPPCVWMTLMQTSLIIWWDHTSVHPVQADKKILVC